METVRKSVPGYSTIFFMQKHAGFVVATMVTQQLCSILANCAKLGHTGSKNGH